MTATKVRFCITDTVHFDWNQCSNCRNQCSFILEYAVGAFCEYHADDNCHFGLCEYELLGAGTCETGRHGAPVVSSNSKAVRAGQHKLTTMTALAIAEAARRPGLHTRCAGENRTAEGSAGTPQMAAAIDQKAYPVEEHTEIPAVGIG